MKKKSMMRSLAVLLLLALSASARGDGGFVPPYGGEIWETNQRAAIFFDPATEVQDLILNVDFEGEVKDFGWIVPVPAIAEVDTVPSRIFYDLAQLTRPLYRDRSSGWGCLPAGPGGEDLAPPQTDGRVEVHAEETVGIYRTMVVGSDDASALADSLEDWGYLHEENREAVEEALQHYIDRSWSYVAMRIDSTSFREDHRAGSYGWAGSLDPVRLRFPASAPVYPIRISSISAHRTTPVYLYVFTNHRVDFPGARTEYANDIDPLEWRAIVSDYPSLARLLDRPWFLTKLYRRFAPDEMTEDLVLERASTNEEYRMVFYTGRPPGDLLLLASVGGVLFALAGRRASYRRGRR